MSPHEHINDRTQARADSTSLEAYEDDIVHVVPAASALQNIELFAREISSLSDNDPDSPESQEILARELHATILLIRGDLQRATNHLLANNPSELPDALADIATDASATIQQCLHALFGSCNECGQLALDPEVVRRHVVALTDNDRHFSFPEQLTTQLESQLTSTARHVFDHLSRQ